jgi:hypothetical protein
MATARRDMSDTPETDALVASINSDTDIVRHEHDFCEMTWLARRLERERNKARRELDTARRLASAFHEDQVTLLQERNRTNNFTA